MAVTCGITEAYGTTPTTAAGVSYLNFLAANIASGADATTTPNANPIGPIPGSGSIYSYERYFYLQFAGNTNAITGIYVWKSAGTLNTGFTINAAIKSSSPTAFATPVATASSIATGAIPTTQGTGLTPAYNATGGPPNGSGTRVSGYIVAQLAVASNASPGPMIGTVGSPGTWTCSYQYNTTG